MSRKITFGLGISQAQEAIEYYMNHCMLRQQHRAEKVEWDAAKSLFHVTMVTNTEENGGDDSG